MLETKLHERRLPSTRTTEHFLPAASMSTDPTQRYATGCNSKEYTASSLCLKNVPVFEHAIVEMVQGCNALAAFLICLATPVIASHGASVPRWSVVASACRASLASGEDNEIDTSRADLVEAFSSKNVLGIAVKAVHQVLSWIEPPGQTEDDDPLSGSRLQFSHYYYGMDEWQTYVVYRIFPLIKKELHRKGGAHWLDHDRPEKPPKNIGEPSCRDQLRAALVSYAESTY